VEGYLPARAQRRLALTGALAVIYPGWISDGLGALVALLTPGGAFGSGKNRAVSARRP
jgi:hypothetical protein